MTDLGESVNVTTAPIAADKDLTAEIIEVEFLNPFKACIKQAVISPPHWPAAVDGLGLSAKAVVLAYNKAPHKVKVKIKITSTGYSGDGKLKGTLGAGLMLEGTFPLASGEHSVELTSTSAPAYLSWIKAPIFWGLEASDQSISVGRTPVEVFFVFADPAALAFFSPKGVWIEALRFIFTKARLDTLTDEKTAVAEVAKACFNLDTHKYDVERGASFYGGATGVFKLTDYISPLDGKVNCYDQTYAVISFSGALGLVVEGLFLEPFGFIRPTNLVGWGRCNNPFPRNFPIKDFLVVDPQSSTRSAFGNHMFCEFISRIYDACAGPAVGTRSRRGYVIDVIDDVMPAGYPDSVKGTPLGMLPIISVPRRLVNGSVIIRDERVKNVE